MALQHKILFTGSMGAGKTTSIAALSEIPPVVTEASNSDRALFDKDTTTVAMDYGEFTLDDGGKIQLVGTPGQMRFDFMWEVLSRGALGVILLIDNSRPDPTADLRTYISHFRSFAESGRMAIGVGRSDVCPMPDVDSYASVLMQDGLILPVLTADVRNPDDVLMLLNALLSQLEVGA